MIIVLDSGGLGILTNPKATPLRIECRFWVRSLMSKGYRVILPEIADCEVWRELRRANKRAGTGRLDELC